MTTLLVGLLLFLGNHSVALMALRARRLGKTPGRNVLEGAVFAGVAGWLCVHRLGLWPGARAAGVALKPAQRFSAPGRAADVAGFFVAVCGLPAWACPAGSEAPDVAGGQILGAGAFAGPAGHWRHAGQCGAVWWFLRVGGGRAHFGQAPRCRWFAAQVATRPAQGTQQCHRAGGRSGGLCGVCVLVARGAVQRSSVRLTCLPRRRCYCLIGHFTGALP